MTRFFIYLDASPASPLYLVVVVLAAAWTGTGALQQEVKRAPITCSFRTGAAQTRIHQYIEAVCLPQTAFKIFFFFDKFNRGSHIAIPS